MVLLLSSLAVQLSGKSAKVLTTCPADRSTACMFREVFVWQVRDFKIT